MPQRGARQKVLFVRSSCGAFLRFWCLWGVIEWFSCEGSVGKNPKGDDPVGETEDDPYIHDAAPRLGDVADSDNHQNDDEGNGVGFDFCFSVGVEIPHTEDGCKDVAEPVRVITEVFDAGGCAGGVFELEAFVSFKVEHEKGKPDECNPVHRGELHVKSFCDFWS